MELQNGTIQNYKKEIVKATNDQSLDLNNSVNAKPVSPKKSAPLEGTFTIKKVIPQSKDTIDKYGGPRLPDGSLDESKMTLNQLLAAERKSNEGQYRTSAEDADKIISEKHEDYKQ